MKKYLLFLTCIILTINGYSQIIFEKGYYINNADQKVECLIKNEDWRSNPTKFEYKLTEDAQKEKITIENVKEFGIQNTSKYLKAKVNIDRSSENVNKLSNEKAPSFEEEELFLKVLVEGQSSLYEYIDQNLVRYFYSKDGKVIEQLIFKSYKKDLNDIVQNNRFREQLWLNLKCPSFTMSKLENLNYQKKSLVRFFVQYNECNEQTFTNFEKKEKRDLFNLTVRPGLNNSSLSMRNFLSSFRDADFGRKSTFRIGIESEFIMSFNKNKWALIAEPTYQYFKAEYIRGTQEFAVFYNSIELPVGLRHYFFLNENSKFFINGVFLFDLNLSNSSLRLSGRELDITSLSSFAYGAGYKHNDKYSLEFRYLTSRGIMNDYVTWVSKYNTLSLVFGYSFF